MTAAQLPSVCRLSWRPRTLRHLLGGDSFFSESLETQWSRHPTGHLYCQRPTWARDLRLAVWLLPRGGGGRPCRWSPLGLLLHLHWPSLALGGWPTFCPS